MIYKIALFGEAEKGEFGKPLHFQSISDLALTLGNPPEDSQGIHFAIQALMYQREIIFFRVKEEGFSEKDYLLGLKTLEKNIIKEVAAVGLPGVGSEKIIDISANICETYKRLLITTEKDLYDYLTAFTSKKSE
ncbi:MAG: hypothetical protein Tsb0015_10270 [Simkaniaceae bacterium]